MLTIETNRKMVTYFNRRDLMAFADYLMSERKIGRYEVQTKLNEFEFINKLEKYLGDLQNLIDCSFFPKELVTDFVSREYEHMDLQQFISVGGELIRMFLMTHKDSHRTDVSPELSKGIHQDDIDMWLSSTRKRKSSVENRGNLKFTSIKKEMPKIPREKGGIKVYVRTPFGTGKAYCAYHGGMGEGPDGTFFYPITDYQGEIPLRADENVITDWAYISNQ